MHELQRVMAAKAVVYEAHSRPLRKTRSRIFPGDFPENGKGYWVRGKKYNHSTVPEF